MGKPNGLSFVEAAFQVLSTNKIAMSPKDIADIILKKGMLKTSSARPDATLSARLRLDKRFIKIRRGLWTIR